MSWGSWHQNNPEKSLSPGRRSKSPWTGACSTTAMALWVHAGCQPGCHSSHVLSIAHRDALPDTALPLAPGEAASSCHASPAQAAFQCRRGKGSVLHSKLTLLLITLRTPCTGPKEFRLSSIWSHKTMRGGSKRGVDHPQEVWRATCIFTGSLLTSQSLWNTMTPIWQSDLSLSALLKTS